MLILLWDPRELFAPGFQLTFVAVWALICVYPQLSGMLWPWQDLLSRVQCPEERTFVRETWLYARSYLLLSCTVWIATAPIRAYHFNSLSLTAPLLNLLMWPLVLCLLLTCFLMVPLLPIGGAAPTLMVSVALFFSGNIDALLRTASSVPGFCLYVPSPPIWWLGLFYGAAAIWALRVRLPDGRRLFLIATSVLCAASAGYALSARSGNCFRMTVFDVGYGQAAMLEAPGGPRLLVDAGSFPSRAGDVLWDCLWARAATNIDGALVSHYNADHCNLLGETARRFRIPDIILPAAAHAPPFAGRLRESLQQQGCRIRSAAEGTQLQAGPLNCEVLHPDARFLSSEGISENERSLVVRCRYAGLTVLFTGDIESAAMDRLTRVSRDRLRADILVLPHHGHYHEGLEELVGCVRPRAAIVSGPAEGVGEQTYGLLRRAGIPLWITGTDGAIIVEFRDGLTEVKGHASGRSTRFRPGFRRTIPDI
jgi:competence protein ComEC